jgi:hypothetical protein
MADIFSVPSYTTIGLYADRGTPEFIGQTYWCSDTLELLLATGTASNADWKHITVPVSTTANRLLVSTATKYSQLAPGSEGDVLKIVSGAPAWASLSTALTGCKVRSTVTQVRDGTTTTAVISWGSEDFDVGGFWAVSPNPSRVTIPSGQSGYYRVELNALYIANATSNNAMRIEVRKNGSTILTTWEGKDFSIDARQTCSFSDVLYLSATDYIEIVLSRIVGTGTASMTQPITLSVIKLGT